MKPDLDYVRAALALQGYAFTTSDGEPDEARLIEVARQFARIAVIAEPMLALQLPEDAEPAPVFRP